MSEWAQIGVMSLGFLLLIVVLAVLWDHADRVHQRRFPEHYPSNEPAELPRANDLAPRSWRMPNGEIIGEAVNWDAVELLKNNPDEYFRRTRPAGGGLV